MEECGASGETRTLTGLPLEPKSSASTNFATLAHKKERRIIIGEPPKHNPEYRAMLKLLFTALVILSSLKSVTAQTTTVLDVDYLRFKTQQLEIQVEIAATPALRETGLMYRTALPAKQGMLFVFEQQDNISLWMKNTRLALDVIFINAQGRIVELLKQLPPCQQAFCPVYRSAAPASYMLELNAGFIDQHRIAIGESVALPF